MTDLHHPTYLDGRPILRGDRVTHTSTPSRPGTVVAIESDVSVRIRFDGEKYQATVSREHLAMEPQMVEITISVPFEVANDLRSGGWPPNPSRAITLAAKEAVDDMDLREHP